jgi:bifunctional non-homologous end joining protein LigD
LAKRFSDPIRLNEVFQADAKTLLSQVKRLGLEGVVAKRADSRYEAGKRSGAWVKYRINEREDLLIGGYLPGRTGLDALLVGRNRAGRLYFVKKVRNGFVADTRRELLAALKPLRTRDCPFVNLPEPSSRRGAVDAEQMRECVWVRPERRAEIEYAEQTAGGRLRHAAFRTLVD